LPNVSQKNPALMISDSRLASRTPRKDFLSDVIDKMKAGEVSIEELTAHASTFV